MKTNVAEYLAVCIPVPDGGLSIMFPDVKGCVSYGRNMDEAKCNAAEALSLHIDGIAEDGDQLPVPKFKGNITHPGDVVIRVRVPVNENVCAVLA